MIDDILKLISGDAMLQQARRLGLVQGRQTLILDDMEEHDAMRPRPRNRHGTARLVRGQSIAMPGRRSFRRAPTRRSCSRRCARRALRPRRSAMRLPGPNDTARSPMKMEL